MRGAGSNLRPYRDRLDVVLERAQERKIGGSSRCHALDFKLQPTDFGRPISHSFLERGWIGKHFSVHWPMLA